jgi:microcompartment protein CcmL/EutN
MEKEIQAAIDLLKKNGYEVVSQKRIAKVNKKLDKMIKNTHSMTEEIKNHREKINKKISKTG